MSSLASSGRMDPLEPSTYRHQYTWLNGIRFHYVDEGEKNDKLMIFFHGYPDFWYGWRYQVPHFVKLGYRVIVPDLRGYNETLNPYVGHDGPDVDANLAPFTLEGLSSDMCGLLDQLGYAGKKVVVVGHDWGGWFAWRFVQRHPERVRAVAVLCTAYTAPNKSYVSTEKLAQIYPNWMYQVFFNSPGAEAQLLSSIKLYFTLTLRGAADFSTVPAELRTQLYTRDRWALAGKTPEEVGIKRGTMVTEKELEEYVKAYTRGGFNGGLNWYRVRHLNHDQEVKLNPVIDQFPALMVTAGKDPALSPAMARKMHQFIPNLRMEHIEEGGHWLQVEHHATINSMIEKWLKEVVEAPGKGKL
ncbi:Alpha/Beta hydrolase protein [Hyaloraphidium curvatum]|nr:Alpha/Beta hydrolase protein [Hyaloraphidium curvatum]